MMEPPGGDSDWVLVFHWFKSKQKRGNLQVNEQIEAG